MRIPSGESIPPEETQNAIHSSAGAATPDDETAIHATNTTADPPSDITADPPSDITAETTVDITAETTVDPPPDTTIQMASSAAETSPSSATERERASVSAQSEPQADADAADDAGDDNAAQQANPADDSPQQETDGAYTADGAGVIPPGPPPGDTHPHRRTSRPAWRRPEDEAERVARSGTFILTMTLVSALLVSGLLLTLSSVTRLNSGPNTPDTQRQTTPTPTTTVFPTPTSQPGFQLYIDHSDGFLIQYPTGWTLASLAPGIDFKDDPNSPGYIVQVLFPGSFSTPGGDGRNQNTGAFWVNYALNGLSTTLSQQGMGVLSRQANCPAPYDQPTTIGGVAWQCGAGYDLVGVTPTPTGVPGATPTTAPTVTPRPTAGAGATQTPNASACANGSCLQVVVLATVYHGKPYIISLLTSSDRFEAGNIEFFQPMLDSFEFLPQS